MHHIDLSIIIVNWNSRDYLDRCLASMSLRRDRLCIEIAVVDSASYDGCAELVSDKYPHVRFIQSTENLGFARSNNLAARGAVGDWLLFLNPDTELSEGALLALHEQATTLTAPGLIGAKLLNTDGTVDTNCVQPLPTITNQLVDAQILRRLLPSLNVWGNADAMRHDLGPTEVEAVSGACCMVDRNLFNVVGGFSEEYFMYSEDLDLSYKVRLAGRRNYYVPMAVVTHHGGSSSSRSVSGFSAVMQREALWRFFGKTKGPFYAATYRATVLISALLRLAILAVSVPLGGSRALGGGASIKKWFSILRWSLHSDRVVRQYYAPLPPRAGPLRK